MRKTKFPKVHDVLNKLKWTGHLDFSIKIIVKDRLSGTKILHGDQIQFLRHREFEVMIEHMTTIPYYKIIKITQSGETIWERPEA